ncbi:AAA family ATPase [Streptomyces prunicolor]|uniref:AAA family ATPase n=1 Tax=Streptomyces prunicolor TaxID=67348 RepID=UPI0037D0CB36
MSSASRPSPANLALSRKEDFKEFVDAPRRMQPETLNREALRALGATVRVVYDRARREWHANLGPIRTPQLASLHEDLWDVVDSNLQDGDKAKGAVAVDAFPGLGKTTAVLAFAREFHRREIAEHGAFTAQGHERWPVCRVGLTGNTGMKDLNRAMLEFFGHPGRQNSTAAQLGLQALDCVLSCEVRLLILDDLHFLKWRKTSGIEVSNHLKWIANEFPVTLLKVGVGLADKGLFSEGEAAGETILAQTGRRTTRLDMPPFAIDTEQGRRHWRQLLLAVEQRVVLADTYPGMLADDLSDYLFARSTGHIGSLITLINRGCQRAQRTGAERLTQDLLDRVKNDEAAEEARKELECALHAGKATSRPHTVRAAG